MPRLVDSAGATFRFEGGSTLAPHSVVWADQVRDPDSGVVQTRGATSVPGLYVLGLPWMYTRGSALLSGVGRDASRIAGMIGRRP